MMPQQEDSEAINQQADPAYGKYEGNQTLSAHQPKIKVGGSVFYDWRYEGNSTSSAQRHDETFSEQAWREGASGKVYPIPHDNTNILIFTLALIALGLILLFGLLFVMVIGGTTGWASFTVACIAILIIGGVGIIAIKTH